MIVIYKIIKYDGNDPESRNSNTIWEQACAGENETVEKAGIEILNKRGGSFEKMIHHNGKTETFEYDDKENCWVKN